MNNKELYKKLFLLLNKKFILKVKLNNKSLYKTHLIKKNKKEIARINSIISNNIKNNVK